MNRLNTYILSGGGTGGHLYPALAIADRIRSHEPDCEIHFIGTKKGLETRVIPEYGYPLHLIAVRGMARNQVFRNIAVPFRLLYSLFQSWRLLKKLDPVIVIGTGGYVSGPVLYIAAKMGIPTLIQEQNSYPGVTTRLLSRYVDRVHLSFQRSLKFLKRHDICRLTGNPVRPPGDQTPAQARQVFALHPDRLTVLIFGGSQGAHAINTAVLAIIDRLLQQSDLQIIWGAGQADADWISSQIPNSDRLWCAAYIENMPMAYRAADIAISRAGAIALAELAVNHLPSILIPYPFAAADHQTENATALHSAGAAWILPQNKLTPDRLLSMIIKLIQDEQQRQVMSKKAREMAFPDAAETLYQSIQEVRQA